MTKLRRAVGGPEAEGLGLPMRKHDAPADGRRGHVTLVFGLLVACI